MFRSAFESDVLDGVADSLHAEADSLSEGLSSKAPMERLSLRWSDLDESILQRIRASSDIVFSELFTDAIRAVNRFYALLQPSQLNGPLRVTELTGQDLSAAILELQRAKMTVAPEVDRLRSEAIYAKRVADDAFDDAWPSSGTQADRTARASQGVRAERYHAFFRYYVYSRANVFFKEIDELVRRLDGIRYTLTRESPQ